MMSEILTEQFNEFFFNLFSLKHELFEFMGQSVSTLEVISTVTGLLCIFLAVKGKVANFWIGYLYNIFLFLLFLQARAYSSMILQPISLIINFYGHYRWTHPKEDEKDAKQELKVTIFNNGQRAVVLGVVLIFTFVWGYIQSRIDTWFPTVFSQPAKVPYFDAFVLGMVLMAQYLSAQKKLDCWGCWMVANVSNVILCLRVGLGIMPIVYGIYIILAIGGFFTWRKMYLKQHYLDLREQVLERQRSKK